MKLFRRLSAKHSTLLTLFLSLLVIAGSLFLSNEVLENTVQENTLRKTITLIFFIVLSLSLLIVAVYKFIQLTVQYHSDVPGSRLRMRVVSSLIVAVLVPFLFMGGLSFIFIKMGIEEQFAPVGQKSLEAGKRLSEQYQERFFSQIMALARSEFLSGLLSDPNPDAEELWTSLKDIVPELVAFQITHSGGRIDAGNPDMFIPQKNWRNYYSINKIYSRTLENRIIGILAVNVGENEGIVSVAMPDDFNSNTKIINEELEMLSHYEQVRKSLPRIMLLLWLFLSGPLILLSLLVGMILCEGIVQPLINLGKAISRIAEGDLSFRVLPSQENDLSFLIQTFNSMVQELEVSRMKILQTEKVAAWQIIARRLANELHNPLTPIKLTAQRIQRKIEQGTLGPEALSRKMELVLRETGRMEFLLKNFREFAGGDNLTLSQFNITSFLEMQIAQNEKNNKGVEFKVMASDRSITVNADQLQIGRVIRNLLRNSVEAEADRVAVQIDPVYRGTFPYVRIQIRDNGRGIPQDQFDFVFQPYNTTKTKGTGFGLAVAQRIINDHRGRIWFESKSKPEHATIFYFELPVEGKS